MSLFYRSTRDDSVKVTASQAILKGLAADGGLYVPEQIPALDKSFEELSKMSYQEVAYEVMKLMLDDFTEEELKSCINKAYDSKFDTKVIAPLVKADGAYYLELFHGSTIAFKDMALSILPHLLITSAKKNNVKNEIVILTATSGDTGKAALAGFADVKGTKIIVFYPKHGVSPIQEKQMVTQKGDNTYEIGINGNFDDAQTGVKKIFGDKELEKVMNEAGYQFSSANSINIGRLVPQIVYYFYAYSRLVKTGEIKCGDKINIVVPTGNFGNILAAYYAKEMGLCVDKLICASNQNNVLTDFIKTGVYDKNRKFETTISPSMDILISSNLERLLFHMSGKNFRLVKEYMTSLSENGKYSVDKDIFDKISNVFRAGYCDDEETKATIKSTFEKYNYTIDTHTAVAKNVYDKYTKETGDEAKTVIASTANPYKFNKAVLEAISDGELPEGEFELIDLLHQISGLDVPKSLAGLKSKFIRFNTTCAKDNLWSETKKFLTK